VGWSFSFRSLKFSFTTCLHYGRSFHRFLDDGVYYYWNFIQISLEFLHSLFYYSTVLLPVPYSAWEFLSLSPALSCISLDDFSPHSVGRSELSEFRYLTYVHLISSLCLLSPVCLHFFLLASSFGTSRCVAWAYVAFTFDVSAEVEDFSTFVALFLRCSLFSHSHSFTHDFPVHVH